MVSVGPAIRFVEVRGRRRIAYRETGEPEGEPVILVHALASDSSSWNMIGSHLADAGLRVIALDLPGHGRSDRLAGYSLDAMEDELALAIDRLDVDRFDLIGHSLGGHLALRLAARSPGRVRRLIAVSVPVPPRDEADADRIAHRSTKLSAWRLIKLLGVGRLIHIALLGRFDREALKPIVWQLRQPMPQWWADLGQIRSTILLLTGSNDEPITSRADLLMAGVEGAELQVIGTGHHPHRDHQDAFLQVVMPFLTARELQERRAAF